MLFAFVGYFQARCIFHGICTRGAISQGVHFLKRKKNYRIMISAPLVRAVVLEKEKAIFPRVIIDKAIIREIMEQQGPVAGIEINIEDDEYFVDYFQRMLYFLQFYDQLKDRVQIFRELKTMLLKNIENHFDNDRVAEKYRWILEYFSWSSKHMKDIHELFVFEQNIGKKRNFTEFHLILNRLKGF